MATQGIGQIIPEQDSEDQNVPETMGFQSPVPTPRTSPQMSMGGRNPALNYFAGGGLTNTAQAYATRAASAIQLQQQRKAYEAILKQNLEGAKKVYDDAVASNPGIENWIPRPEMWVDEKTGAFMPHDYFKNGFMTGLQEYRKNQLETAKTGVQLAREGREAEYQKKQGELGEKRLGVEQQRIGLAEQGIEQTGKRLDLMGQQLGIGVHREQRLEEAAAAKEERDAEKETFAEIKEYGSKAQSAIKAYGTAFDDNTKKEEMNNYKNANRNLRLAQEKMMRLKSAQEGKPVETEAVKTAMDIQEASDLQRQYEELYGDQMEKGQQPEKKLTEFMSAFGNDFDVKNPSGGPIRKDVSFEATKVLAFAQQRGITEYRGAQLTAENIDKLLQQAPLERVIQLILSLSKKGNR